MLLVPGIELEYARTIYCQRITLDCLGCKVIWSDLLCMRINLLSCDINIDINIGEEALCRDQMHGPGMSSPFPIR